MSQKKHFGDTKHKAHKLYGDSNTFRAILKSGIPGLLISLMTGIYIFADQLMLSQLVPQDSTWNIADILLKIDSTFTQQNIDQWIAEFNTVTKGVYTQSNAADIVKAALSITLPIIFVLNAVPNITATGAGTIYTQSISYGNQKKGMQVWKTTFFLSIAIGLIAALLIFSVSNPMLHFILGKPTDFYDAVGKGLDPTTAENLTRYENTIRSIEVEWSESFLNILTWTQILNIFVVYLSFMIRAEGRMTIVTITGIGCNLLNILLDFVMIKYGHMGMAGASAATAIGWLVNIVIFFVYLSYLGRKNDTWMKLSNVLPGKGSPFSFPLAVPVFIIGFSVFLRNFANAFSNTFFITLLTMAATALPSTGGATHFQTLHGAISPITTLFFYGIFGIADGARSYVAYNYAQHEFGRIKKAYWHSIIVSLMYSFTVYVCLLTFLGRPLLGLFALQPADLEQAFRALAISAIFIPFLSISMGGLLIFQATNELAMANFVAIINGWISFPIVASFMYFVTVNSGDPITWYFSTPINAIFTGGLTTAISLFYMKKYLGKCRIKISLGKKKTEFIRVPYMMAKPSIAQKELMKEVQKIN